MLIYDSIFNEGLFREILLGPNRDKYAMGFLDVGLPYWGGIGGFHFGIKQ